LERELYQGLAGHRLAGELRISEADLELIEDRVESLAGFGMNATRLAATHPALLVVYLTSVGVYRYEAGSYWPNVPIARRLQAHKLGAAFKGAVLLLGLETFDDLVVGEGAAEYVARILAHGGIPRYCLGDYFTALHSGLRHTDDLLSLWRTRRERLAHLDKPVGRFLRYGGAVAVDLVTRSTDLVHETVARGTVPSADEVGLPQYLVDEYARWRMRSGTPDPTARSFSISRPRVELDPWSTTGPHLILPPLRGKDGWWKIAGEGTSQSIRASETREQLVRLAPSRAWEVTLELSSGPARLFTYEAYGELPALFFEPVGATLVRDPLNLQLERVLCVLPSDARIEALASDGTSLGDPKVIERYPASTGEWRGFELRLFDLDGVARLRLTHDGVERTVRVSEPMLRPSIEGDVVFATTTADGLSVYRRPPRIRIPDDLISIGWTLRIGRRGEAPVASTVRAGTDGHVDFLPEDAFGEFEIRLAGPLGSDLHQQFAVVPGLVVAIPDKLLLPDDTDETVRIEVADGLVVNGVSSVEEVEVPADLDVVTLSVADRLAAELDLYVSVPRLVWGVVADTGIGAGLAAEKVRIDAGDVDGGNVRALMVRTGRPGLRLSLQLASRAGVVQQREAVETQAEGRWAFDLRPFQDAVRLSDESTLWLELLVGVRSVRVADIVARYVVRNLAATSRTVGDFTEVALEFEESTRFNSRVARLWSLDRPWEDAVEHAIPDAQGPPAVLRGDELIPPGPYLAEIAIDDGWTKRVRPMLQAENAARVFVSNHADWRARVERLNHDDLLEALEAVVATRHVTDETLAALDFGPVAPQALSAFVWMLEHVPPGELLPPATNAVRKALLDTFVDFLGAIADAPERGVQQDVLRRVELLCLRRLDSHVEMTVEAGLALADDSFRSLWRAAPAIAATVDLAIQKQSGEAAERLSQQLTSDEPPVIDPGGFRVDPHLLGRPADLLREIGDVLDAYPGPLMIRRTLEAAYLEFLIAESEVLDAHVNVQPSKWFDQHRALIPPLLGIPGYKIALEERIPGAGVLPWAGLPALTLAAAIHVRRQTLHWQRATRALDEALLFAPTLVEHDLISAILLIDRLREEGQQC
jgi:hypothetical protein